MYHALHKILSSTVFNNANNNNKIILEQQIRLLEWFLQERDTEDWRNVCWKFSFAITKIDYILKYITIKKLF